eukprot:gene5713-6605_t
MLTFKQLAETEADFKSDPKWRVEASSGDLEAVAKILEKNGHKATVVADEKEALDLILKSIPKGASVMNAGSASLAEIGFNAILKTETHGWENLHHKILTSPADQQGEERRKAMGADYFLSSVASITKDGVMFVCDASGTRVGPFPFSAKNIIVVCGNQKIVANDELGMARVYEHCLPCESVRARFAYKVPGSQVQTMLRIANGANGRIHVILVNKPLGY